MLSTRVLRMSSPIAMAIVESPDNAGIRSKLSPVVEALCAVSYTTFPYTRTDAVEQIAEVCNGTSEHHAMMTEASERIANGVRSGLKQISTYVKPIVERLSQRLNGWGDGFLSDVVTEVHDQLALRFVRLDCPYYTMGIYPAEINNSNIDYASVDAARVCQALGLLSDEITPERLSEIMVTSSSEINQLFEDVDMMDCYRNLSRVSNQWARLFTSLGNNAQRVEKQIDFTATLGANIPELLGTYVLAKCFIINDDILPFVKDASLDEFRNRMKYVCSLLECTLVKTAQLMKTYAAVGYRVIHEQMKVNNTEGDVCKGIYHGEVIVGYTEGFLNALEQTGVCSLSELTIGYLIAGRKGDRPSGALEHAAEFKAEYDAYIKSLSKRSAEQANQVIGKIVYEVIREKQACFNKLRNNVVGTESESLETISKRLEPAIKEFIAGFNKFVVEREFPVANYVANSPLIVAITRAFGMEFAARILELATTAEPGLDDRGRRERLAEAVVEATVEVCTGAIK